MFRKTTCRSEIAFANGGVLPGFWKTENGCDMTSIFSTNKTHQAACDNSEMLRQAAIAAAGGSAAAIQTAEIAHYRRIIASCVANGLPYSNFTYALLALGTNGA
jgi:hypothetical protein